MSEERRGQLVLVATPIGNLGDLSPRAREVLATADLICCEDTRRTRALLSASGITAKGPHGDRLLSLHGHNEASRLDRVAAAVAGGATVAVVSDAGTPGISDPGAWLAAQLAAAGATVSTVPGPSSVLGALVVSGLPADRFCVEGFLPRKGPERRRRLGALHGRRAHHRRPGGPEPGGGHARRAGRRRRGPAGGGGARADQAARGGLAWHARRGGGRLRGAGRSGARSSWSSAGPRQRRRPARTRSRPPCGPRSATIRRRARARWPSWWRRHSACPGAAPTRPLCACAEAPEGEVTRRAAPEGAGTLPAVPPYYLTTPIYYVNDAPHVGTAYTTVNADALARWHRLLGDDVWFMTGTDEHGAKIVEAAEANETTPKEWTDRTSARFVEAWSRLDIANDDFIRTTEPRHYEVVQQFLQRIYDNGFIELGSYSGLYCVSCEDYYLEDQLVDGKCPVHGRPVIEMKEDNYFFKLSQFEEPPARLLREPPRLRPPDVQAQRGPRLHPGRAAGRVDHPDLLHVGRARAVGQRARLLRLVRRAHQLPDGGRLRRRSRRVRGALGRRPPPDREGHPQVPLRLVARHVHGGRHGAAGGDLRPRVPADGRAEARQDDDRVRPGRRRRGRAAARSPTCRRWPWPTTSASTRCATTCCARWRWAATATSPTRASWRATTRTWPTIWAISCRGSRPSSHSKCGGVGPGCNPSSELAPVAAAVLDAATSAWARWAPARGARGDLAAHRRGQRGARVGRALEDGARAGRGRGPRRRPRGPAHRGRPHCAGHAVDRSRGVAPHRRGGRPLGGPACPTTPSGAATPAARPW